MQTMINSTQIEELKKQIAQFPDDPTTLVQLGDLYVESGKKHEAIEFYKKALRLDPANLGLQVNLDRINRENQKTLIFSDDRVGTGYISQFLTMEIPVVFQVLISLISFFIVLILATLQEWRINELVWSLWISSLSIGYTFLISAIVAKAIHRGMAHSEIVLPGVQKWLSHPLIGWIIAIVGGIYTIAFFTVHFGGFHFVHGIFLNLFFPIQEVSQGDLPNFFIIIKTCLTTFWPVILLSMLMQIKNFQQIILFPEKDLLAMPYKNVVKMHISIILFAFLSKARVNDIILPYLLILYFFPFQAVINYFKNRKTEQIADLNG